MLQAKAVSGGLCGCFQILVKLKSVSIKLWYGAFALICSEKLNKYVQNAFYLPYLASVLLILNQEHGIKNINKLKLTNVEI